MSVYKMPQAFDYVDIDCDLYISSIQALDWIFKNKLAKVGTIIGYDDWWVDSCSAGAGNLHPLDTSEGRAHLEITEKYNIEFECVGGSCSLSGAKLPCVWGSFFRIKDIGSADNRK